MCRQEYRRRLAPFLLSCPPPFIRSCYDHLRSPTRGNYPQRAPHRSRSRVRRTKDRVRNSRGAVAKSGCLTPPKLPRSEREFRGQGDGTAWWSIGIWHETRGESGRGVCGSLAPRGSPRPLHPLRRPSISAGPTRLKTHDFVGGSPLTRYWFLRKNNAANAVLSEKFGPLDAQPPRHPR